MISDDILLRRYVETRAEDAFSELVRRHLSLVYYSALRQVSSNAHRAQDVTQLVFVLLARRAPALTHHPSLAGWLHTAARNTARDVLRREHRRQRREEEAQRMTIPKTAATEELDWQQLSPIIDDALRALDTREREAVLLRFFEGRTFSEVGTGLRLTEDAARMCVNRSLEKLRGILVKRGVASTGAALGMALADQAIAAVPEGIATIVTNAAMSGMASTGTLGAITNLMSITKIGMVAVTITVVVSTSVVVSQHRTAVEPRQEIGALESLRNAYKESEKSRAADALQLVQPTTDNEKLNGRLSALAARPLTIAAVPTHATASGPNANNSNLAAHASSDDIRDGAFSDVPVAALLQMYGIISGKNVAVSSEVKTEQARVSVNFEKKSKAEVLRILEEVLATQARVEIVHEQDGSFSARKIVPTK